MSRPTVADVAALRAELAEAHARIRELELRLHLRPWTQHLPPLFAIPLQRPPLDAERVSTPTGEGQSP